MMSRNLAAYDPANDPLAVPRNSAQVEHILATVRDQDDQIDAICEARGITSVNAELREILDAYLDESVSISETIDLLAAPIEESYISADQGYLLWETESAARQQRPLCGPPEALEFWGEPVAMCEPDPANRPQHSLEGQLWSLYFGIIHAARKQAWAMGDGRLSALVVLIQALQNRADPAPPDNATPGFQNHGICSTGALWSNLCMLGPCATESYNDAPGGTMGFTGVETRMWENLNAFFAHLTATGTVDFMIYGVGAMRNALEGGIARQNQMRMTREFKGEWIDITVGVIFVWLQIAGEEMYARVRYREETEEPEVLMENGMSVEWKGEPTAARWAFWKRRLAKLSQDNDDDAMRALVRMHYIEARFAWWGVIASFPLSCGEILQSRPYISSHWLASRFDRIRVLL
jgi:hypothetical protein